MFNWKRNKGFDKNRRRFEEIISDSRNNFLMPIFKDLKEGIEKTDEEVMEAYLKFSSKIQTNTIAAAELEFVIVATIAAHKPNLSAALLSKPLLMLVWTFGDEITGITVSQFIDKRILNDKAKPYGGLPDKKAVNWLKEYFTNNREVVESMLDEVIDNNNNELEKLKKKRSI